MIQKNYQNEEVKIRDAGAINYDVRYTSSKGVLFDSLEKNLFFECVEQNSVVLDLGCGTGRICERISEKTNNLYACDFSEKSLNMLKQKNIIENKQIFRQDIKQPFHFGDNYFDVIYSCQVIQHLHLVDLLQSLKEIKRILKKDGLFIFSVYNGDCIFNRYKEELLDNGLYIRRFDKSHINYITNSIGMNLLKLQYYNVNPILHKFSGKFNMVLEKVLEKIPFCNRKLGKYIFVVLKNK